MALPLGNPFVKFDKKSNKFENLVEIGFNNLLLNTGLDAPGNPTLKFDTFNSILSVEENSIAVSGRALKCSPKYIESTPVEVWTKKYNDEDIVSMIVDSSGNIYIGSTDSTIKKLKSDGTQLWSFSGNEDAITSLYVDNDTYDVYSSSKDKKLKKINSSGTEKWEYSSFISPPKCIKMDSKNNLYVCDGNVIRVISSGDTPKQINLIQFASEDIISGIELDNLDNLYVYMDGIIKKMDINGNLIWQYRCADKVKVLSIHIDSDYNLYVCGSDKLLRKISYSGMLIWDYSRKGFSPTECITDYRGNLYSCSSNNAIFKFTTNSDIVWEYSTTSSPKLLSVDLLDNFYFVLKDTFEIKKNYMDITYKIPDVSQKVRLLPSTVYTLSLLFKSTISGIMSINLDDISFNEVTTDTYSKFTYCFKTSDNIRTDIDYLLQVSINNSSAMYISDLKLETGNMSTTWCSSSKDEKLRYDTHQALTIMSDTGVHGMRYIDETLQIRDGISDWIEIKTGGGSGGIIAGGEDYFNNATEFDNTAEYNTVKVSASQSEDVPFFEATFEEMILGRYSCMLRLKTSNISITTPVIKIEVFHRLHNVDTKLLETYIRGTDFDAVNVWKSLGFILDFHGDRDSDKLLVIKGTVLEQSQFIDISMDYCVINFVYTSVGALQTVRF